jgi:hypothetical protein
MTATPHGPAFSVQEIPFSHRGSWFDVSPVVAQHTTAPDLHLVSHQNGLHPVLRLVPLRPGSADRARTRWRATASLLTWQDGDARIDLAYDGAETVRVRGRGLDLLLTPAAGRLTPFSGVYAYRDPVDGSYHFTSYETGRRYRVTPLAGTAAAAGLEALGDAERHVVLSGRDGWEAAVEEIDSSRPPYAAAADFPAVAERSAQAFHDFAAAVAGPPADQAPAAQLAAYVLWSATVRPAGLLRRPAVLMSKHWMDKVWSWDHCFNALALAPGLPELAWDQFQLPFDHQDASGALPDSVAHSEVLYNFVKPPVHGWALRRLRARTAAPPDTARLREAYRRLAAWTDFWLTARTAPGQRLPYYHHGNDSGWDNATTFDARRVTVSADLAALLVLQLAELTDLAREIGRPDEADRHLRTARRIEEAMLDELWDGERFRARSPHTGEPTAGRSLLDLMPIVLGDRLPAEVSARLADRIATHLTPHGLATEHPGSPHYRSDGYWRGPVWAPPTVLIEDGLRRAGHTGLADTVSARFRALCERHGFAENFDALTGQGLRDRAYTWTAAVYLLLADDHRRRLAPSPAR